MTGELRDIKVFTYKDVPGITLPGAGLPCLDCKNRKIVENHVLKPKKFNTPGDGPYRYPKEIIPKPTTNPNPTFSLNFKSGKKDECYKQVLGQTIGCHVRNIKYSCPVPEEDQTEGRENEWVLQNIKSWGECAALAQTGSCARGESRCFWMWSSSACSNCTPEDCWFIRCSEQPTTSEAPGRISGEDDCQDIQYVETNSDFVISIPNTHYPRSTPAGEADWREGSCQERIDETTLDYPKCTAQNVPGFRCQREKPS